MYNFWIATTTIALLLDLTNTILKARRYRGLSEDKIKEKFGLSDEKYRMAKSKADKHSLLYDLLSIVFDVIPFVNVFAIIILAVAVVVRLSNGKEEN